MKALFFEMVGSTCAGPKQRSLNMCDTDKCCQKLKKLKVKPQEYTLGQIQECHGDSKKHPCVSKKTMK